jgi:AraC family transcriptional regulator of adaptative response / DNA-3-methyladenine glycosylase II
MELDPDRCYRALQTRDARFDGHFFTAVRSTGVYCRPICPARLPKRENCEFMPCAAAAQEAGYRPCLRCRPEASPGTPAWQGTSATVSRALRLIADGALDAGSVDALAARLGVVDRHLRRLFLEHLGASPLAVAQTQRLLFAKKLIDETELPMSQIALASGFSSVRRFNDAVRNAWDRTPRSLRAARGGAKSRRTSTSDSASATPTLVLKLPFRAPYDWQTLTAYLAFRAIPGVEVVDADHYARSIRLGELHGTVDVRPEDGENHLVARLFLAEVDDAVPLIRVSERLRRLFDLTADPVTIAAHLSLDPELAGRVRERPGLRVPGAWDGFELAVRAILGQQVSVRGATTLAGRIVSQYGEDLPMREPAHVATGNGPAAPGTPQRLFPRPEALASLDPTTIGLPGARARAISSLARAVADGDIDLNAPADLSDSVDRLCALPGIGVWTAQYIAMRALREPDAFPASDLGLRRALGTDGALASAKQVEAASLAWSPWRAYAAVHLWVAPQASGTARPTRTRAPRSNHSTGGQAR